MRQGLVLLALLGAAIGLETMLPVNGPSWIRSVVIMTEQGLFALVLLVLAASVIQRTIQIAKAVRNPPLPPFDKGGLGGFVRLILTTTHGPFLLLHGGLALLIAAFGYAKSGSVEAVMELPVGSESREARLDDGRRLTLPFTVRATAFETEHYETGEVKQFVGGVELSDGNGVVAAAALGVGAPLDYQGYRFSLFRFGYLGSQVEGSVRSIADPVHWSRYAGEVGGTIDGPGNESMSLVTIVEHTPRRTSDGNRDVGRALVYELLGRDGHRYEVMSFESAAHVLDYRRVGDREFQSVHVLANRDAAQALPFSHYLTVASIEPRKAIGLQIRYYPGLMLLLASGALVVLGVAWMLAYWRPPVVATRSPSMTPHRERPTEVAPRPVPQRAFAPTFSPRWKTVFHARTRSWL